MKPIHGAYIPKNVPRDMVSESPIPCSFKAGDRVIYTNDYGVKFDAKIKGFAKIPHDYERCVYLDFGPAHGDGAWWFAENLNTLSTS